MLDNGEIQYDGEWKNGLAHGNGKFFVNNELEYEGEWLHDKRHGQGTAYNGKEVVYSGLWEYDEPVESKKRKHSKFVKAKKYCIEEDCDSQRYKTYSRCEYCYKTYERERKRVKEKKWRINSTLEKLYNAPHREARKHQACKPYWCKVKKTNTQ